MATQRRMLARPSMTLVIAFFATIVAAAQTTTQSTKGEATVTTEKLNGQVVYAEGNNLVVKMSNGEVRTFSNVPDSRRATIDGREVGVRDLKPGTTLTATITTTTTPVTVRTTTVGTGKVRFVSGNSVILALPDGESKQYTVKPDYKFIVNGKPATVSDLRQGMTVSAEKIVEEPTVEIALNTAVVGQGPRPQAAAPSAASAVTRAPAAAAPTVAAAEPPAQLPKTGSSVLLVGLLGLLLVGGSSAVGMLRRE